MDLSGIGRYFFNGEVMLKALPLLASGLLVTLKVSCMVAGIGFGTGLILALIRTGIAKTRVVGKAVGFLIRVYVDLLRASPYLVLLSLVYFGLPFLGINLSTFWATVITFSACLSAFAEEIFRAGIEAIERGQWEAARSLGLNFFDTMRHVILPQAIRISIPTLTNRTVAISKAISMASAIALPDLLKQARWAQGIFANPSPLIEAALIYILVFFPLVRLTLFLERKWGKPV